MKKTKFSCFLVALLLMCNITAFASETDPTPTPSATLTPENTVNYSNYEELPIVDVRAAAALLVDARSGEILYDKNSHVKREPASVTKVLTCLLVLENGNIDDRVIAQQSAFETLAADGSTAGIQVGEEMTVRDLLYCALLQSANEACTILAEYVSGSVEEFVVLMNKRATELGCVDTNFKNPTGLPDPEHLTTAYDLYLICLEALKNPVFTEIVYTDAYAVPPTNKTPEGRTVRTTNKLISKNQTVEYIYPYAKGIKTGSTNAAGYCLAADAEKNGITLISIILGAEKDEQGFFRNFIETKELFEWGFNNFSRQKISSKTEILAEIKVLQGVDKDAVTLVADSDIEVLVPSTFDQQKLEKKITLLSPDGVVAPVKKGDVLGSVTFMFENHEYGTANLVAAFTIEQSATENIQNIVETTVKNPWTKRAVIAIIVLIVIWILYTILTNMRRRADRIQQQAYKYKGKKRKPRR